MFEGVGYVCPSDAFNHFQKAVSGKTLETPCGLFSASMAISQKMKPLTDTEIEASDALLSSYAECVTTSCKSKNPKTIVSHLHEVLFEQHGFRGNVNNYYTINNNNLFWVLKTKLGLPVTLSIVYHLVARRLGLTTYGINVPGHFLIGVMIDDKPLIVDAYSKGSPMLLKEIKERVFLTFGEDENIDLNYDEVLRPVSNKIWLTRVLQNLLNTHGNQGQFLDVASCLELEMLLWPNEVRLQKDLALVYARCGRPTFARYWLSKYLQLNIDDPQRETLEDLLKVLYY
jgi:regulator of sirC expression with transglutaminase-like and TPR domain